MRKLDKAKIISSVIMYTYISNIQNQKIFCSYSLNQLCQLLCQYHKYKFNESSHKQAHNLHMQ